VVLLGDFSQRYIFQVLKHKSLKGNFNRSKTGIWLRNSMFFQFAIAVFFIIGTTIVYQQVNYLTNKNLGLIVIEIDLKNLTNKLDTSYKNDFFKLFGKR
jgi:putative ABC transport system permease protein